MKPPPPPALPEAPSKYAMDNFSPVGLHVLVVDDDPLCLLVLEKMLKSCSYKVTSCNRAKHALEILRDSEDDIDLVLSDVYMPDVDGFKLLEIIGLELDLPVIKVVPKKLLKVMNVKGLTRENVASHLQKYRLYLKRLSGVMPERCPIASFQASCGGKSGGTMRILPRGRSSSSIPSIKGLNLGAGITESNVGAQNLDVGTVRSLTQLRASQQQQQRSANRAQVLGALGFLDSRQGEAPLRNTSFDLHPYLQVPQSHLFSSHSMPSSLSGSAHSGSQSLNQEDEKGARPNSAQVEGFVSHWNINPVGQHDMREYLASTDAQMQVNLQQIHSSLIPGNMIPNCSEDIQAGRYLDMSDNMNVSHGMPWCTSTTTEMDREANLDALDLVQIPEQFSLSDYLINDKFLFDNQGSGS